MANTNREIQSKDAAQVSSHESSKKKTKKAKGIDLGSTTSVVAKTPTDSAMSSDDSSSTEQHSATTTATTMMHLSATDSGEGSSSSSPRKALRKPDPPASQSFLPVQQGQVEGAAALTSLPMNATTAATTMNGLRPTFLPRHILSPQQSLGSECSSNNEDGTVLAANQQHPKGGGPVTLEDSPPRPIPTLSERTTKRSRIRLQLMQELGHESWMDHGVMMVSWFRGTSSTELQQHVRTSVLRKIKAGPNLRIDDMHMLDTGETPSEEIVLTPFIPSGSEFTLQFRTSQVETENNPLPSNHHHHQQPPLLHSHNSSSSYQHLHHLHRSGSNSDMTASVGGTFTPSASLSPVTTSLVALDALAKLDPYQLAMLRHLHVPPLNNNSSISHNNTSVSSSGEDALEARLKEIAHILSLPSQSVVDSNSNNQKEQQSAQDQQQQQMQPQQQLKRGRRYQEKRQVWGVLAQYLVIFLSLIALLAELQKRAPECAAAWEKQMTNVQDCAANKDALFQCIKNGDFAGLLASVGLWLSQSVVTRRIFLFGFENQQRLWTVVYECFVTATCWGVSYLFIRRGLNPDTRRHFLAKFWKDAVYGSLAGFFASFLKQVLKNFIPDAIVQEAIRERTHFLSWLPKFS